MHQIDSSCTSRTVMWLVTCRVKVNAQKRYILQVDKQRDEDGNKLWTKKWNCQWTRNKIRWGRGNETVVLLMLFDSNCNITGHEAWIHCLIPIATEMVVAAMNRIISEVKTVSQNTWNLIGKGQDMCSGTDVFKVVQLNWVLFGFYSSLCNVRVLM